MKIDVKYNKENLTPVKINIIENFIKFLNREYKLKNDVVIRFTTKSEDGMTTGSNKE